MDSFVANKLLANKEARVDIHHVWGFENEDYDFCLDEKSYCNVVIATRDIQTSGKPFLLSVNCYTRLL